MNEFKILSDLVKFNTIEDKENKEIIEYISNLLTKKGFVTEIVKSNDNKHCLVAKSSDDCNLCFMGHSDTVKHSDRWDTDPFTLTLKDDNLYGLGACDMKGGIAAFIEALDQIDLKELNKGIMIMITYDEELGFDGIRLVKDRKDIPDNIIIGEPTDMTPIAFCKGCMEFKTTFIGKTAHSSYMPKGDNAIVKAMAFIKDLERFAKVLAEETNTKFDVPFTTNNIATINGGISINMVPDKCELTFDFRTISGAHHKVIHDEIDKLCAKYNCTKEVTTDIKPCNTTDVERIKKIEEILNKKTTGVNYTTEGNFLENKNIFIIGPGPITAHEDNEHVSVKSYKKTIKAYKNIIDIYCK